MEKYNSVADIPSDSVGKYIRFGGNGILDGLRGAPSKHDLYRISRIDTDRVSIQEYRAKIGRYIPSFNFNQECEIYTKKEFAAAPKLW